MLPIEIARLDIYGGMMCGVVGAAFSRNPEIIAPTLYTCLYHLQHRGQDSAGMVIKRPDGSLKIHRRPGTIDRVFMNEDLKLPEWQGFLAIGHTRYSTSGVDFRDPRSIEEAERAAQPLVGNFHGERFALSYNGNLTPSCVAECHQALYNRGYGEDLLRRSSWVDTELIVKAIEASSEETFEGALFIDVFPQLRGAFSIVIFYKSTLYAVRDSHGFRPLEVGINQNGYLVASEDNVFTKFPGGMKIRSVNPGETVVLRKKEQGIELSSFYWKKPIKTHFCQFETVYFSRFDSTHGGVRVFEQQEALGRVLARECPPPAYADMVFGVPDSGLDAGYGYALESGLRYEPRALRRLHGVGRTFIEPVSDLRKEGVEFKLVVIPELVRKKTVVVVDDSNVRGNVATRVVYLLKEAGAAEVHLRVSSPPVRFGCWYGIDTYRIEDELIARNSPPTEANNFSPFESIRQAIGRSILKRYGKNYLPDSLHYLSLEGMKSTWKGKEGLCDACWTGKYPVE